MAQKRDERLVVSLDETVEDGGRGSEPAGGDAPDTLFARDWAASLLAGVRQRLFEELKTQGKDSALWLLPAALYEAERIPYRELAQQLGGSEDQVKKTVQRLRERWQKILWAEVLATVETPGEAEEEIRYLLSLVENRR